MLDAPPSAGPLQALLGDVAMGAFDLAGADRQSFGQGLAIVQLAGASAEIAMAGSHGRMLVIDFGGLAMSGERPQAGVETPAFERLFLRLHPGVARDRVGRDGCRGGAQLFADVIEINQIAALVAELLLNPAAAGTRELAPKPARTALDSSWRPASSTPPPISNPHKPASGFLARAPATASPPARTASCPCACLSPRCSARRSEPCRRPSRRRSACEGPAFPEIPNPDDCFHASLGVGGRDPLDRALADREAIVLRQAWRAPARTADRRRSRRWRAAAAANTRAGSPSPRARWTHPLRPERRRSMSARSADEIWRASLNDLGHGLHARVDDQDVDFGCRPAAGRTGQGRAGSAVGRRRS